MDHFNLVKTRFSVRSFKQQPVEDTKLAQILEAGRLAPTACNNQPQRIYVAKSDAARAKLASVCKCTFHAPLILVVCYDKKREWKNDLMPGYGSGETDAAIVCTHMMLQAAELGLGSCWVGWFNAEQVANILELPEQVTVSALLPLGYAADHAKPAHLHSKYRDFEDTIEFI